MKYVIFGLHDLNVAQTLEFLGYYKRLGFKEAKVIDFLSSVRFEVLQRVGIENDLRIIVIYDN